MALRSPYTSPSVRSPDFPFVRRLSNSSPTAGANNWFVRSLAVGTGDGRTWLNAFTTLAAALTAGAAGDTFYVSEDHAETQASAMTLTSPGTAASPCNIYCVNHFGGVPPVSANLRTTGTVTTTGANAMTFAGAAFYYGLAFNMGSGANNLTMTLAGTPLIMQSCILANLATGAGGTFAPGTGAQPSKCLLINTTLEFGAAAQNIDGNGVFIWRNTQSAIAGATLPTTLITLWIRSGLVQFEGVDLSALGSGKTLIGALVAQGVSFNFKDCKLGASVTVAATPSASSAQEVNLIRCDSGGTNYRTERYRYEGTQTVETTIVRTGGASDGTTPLSWKIVTTANSKWVLPFEALPIAIWNDTTGSLVTVTVEGIWGSTNSAADRRHLV
jgi:hypothetical protein